MSYENLVINTFVLVMATTDGWILDDGRGDDDDTLKRFADALTTH